MGKPLRVLIVEDDENDELLLLRELKRGGFDVTSQRVDTPVAMTNALANGQWDIVISDYLMPEFSAPAALVVMKESRSELPFIIVSGTVDEDTAVEAMRAGANDFMPKGKFARLIPAIERELRDAAVKAERLKMREQLLISDRMASLGTLAAGVAHEINNPLAVLTANVSHAVEEVGKLQSATRPVAPGITPPIDLEQVTAQLTEIQGPLKDAQEAAERIRLIVRDLKALSRSDEKTRGSVDIRRVIDSCLRMAWNEIRHRARVVKDLENVPAVAGNEARLGQVFLNLFVNAAQAIPEGRVDENEIRVIAKAQMNGVVVEVRDTGSGIPESALPHVFDPFFTTKPMGTGTGLGLAICHRIVTETGGSIFVESQEGKGTVVRVVLPVAQDLPELTAPPQIVREGRKGRILVVDDEHALGMVLKRMLSPQHEVITTTRPHDAIARLVAGEQYDVILCDLMMPEMTGMELYAELERIGIKQEGKIVFMSGGVFTNAAREFLARVSNRRLDKPFDANLVRSLVQTVIAEAERL